MVPIAAKLRNSKVLGALDRKRRENDMKQVKNDIITRTRRWVKLLFKVFLVMTRRQNQL
jgi:hypothetical protein